MRQGAQQEEQWMRKRDLSVMGIGLAVAFVAAAGTVRAQTEGPVKDPLDTASYRLRAAQLGERTPVLTTGTEFNPAISVILDFTYGWLSDELEDPPGFELGGHSHGHGHDHGIEEGFALRELELTFSGTVDPYFDAMAMVTLSGHDIEIEEAYITTRMLPVGFQIKAGKFLSDIGYINKQHLHDWMFADAPWMREFLMGDEGLSEAGVQLSWLPPTDTYVRLGVEVLQGESEGVASYIGPGRHQMVTILPDDDNAPSRNRWRADKGLDEKDGPRLFTGFAKVAPEIGQNQALQLGVFGGYSRSFQLEEVHSSGRLETWDGDAWFAGFDAVYKYDGQGVAGHRNLVLQGEYMYRQLDLDYRSQQFANFSDLVTTDFNKQRWKQDGLYVQGVYGFAPRWNAGLRADVLGLTNDGFEGRGTPEDFGTSYRYTGQLSYAPTEFSRLRLQASYTDLAEDDHDHDDHHDAWMVVLQYNVSLGVHGAHAF